MLPIRFDLSGVSRVRSAADIRVNAKDEYRNLVYTAKPQGSQVPISFIGMPEPTSADIRIVDLNEIPGSLVVTENSFRARVRRVQEAELFTLPTKSAAITDVTNSDVTGRAVPLWYKHAIADGLETAPEVLDQDMRPVAGVHYKVVIEAGEVAVFHDLYPSVDPENLRTTAYYIRYINTSGEQVFSLLSADSAYTKVSLIDGINPNKREYAVRRAGANWEYRILYNGGGPYYLKIGARDQIKLKKPLLVRATDSWHLSITDGEVFGRAPGVAEWYSIPEYHSQQFSPIQPIKFSGTRECLVLTNHLVKTPVENILLDANNIIEVLVTDKSLSPRAAWTSGPTNPTPYWIDRFERIQANGAILRYPMASLQDRGITVEKAFGLIHLPFKLQDTDRVFVRAKYEAKEFEYLSLNLNPLHSRKLIGGRAVVYCLPESEIDENNRAIYHFILDENNNIVLWNDERLGAGGVLDPSLVPGVGETGYQLFLSNFPNFLVLGTVAVNRSVNPAEIAYIDVRERGGILTPQVKHDLTPLLEKYPELQWVEDESLQGRPFPAQGAFVLEAPFGLLDDAGGSFAEEDVKAAVKKHMALGGYPSIRYYADTPKILGVEFDTVAKELTVTWSEVLHADGYRVYVAEDDEGPYMSAELISAAGDASGSQEVTLGLAGSAAEDLALTANGKLYIYIAPLKDSIEWPASDVAYMDLTVEGAADFFPMDAIIISAPTATANMDAIIVEA